MGTHSPHEDHDRRAERLLRTALDVAVRVREEPPEAVAAELDQMPPDELRDALILAAACIQVDRPISELVWWAKLERFPMADRRGCGTRQAWRRHRAHGEPADVACEIGYRREEMERKRDRYTPVARLVAVDGRDAQQAA